VHLSVYLFSYNSSLAGRRQKLIGALNSAGIGEGAKLKNLQNFFLKNCRGLERAKQNDENKYLGLNICTEI
jgi:hypothetical protein